MTKESVTQCCKTPNGLTYIGELRNKIPHGNGTLINKNGKKIIGKWKNGKIFYKKQKYISGDVYEGYTRGDGKKEGKGKMIYGNGSVYVGEWKNDNKEGKGIFFLKNSYIRGIWKNNLFSGETTEQELYNICTREYLKKKFNKLSIFLKKV
tara:strand:- start:44 stop:496 length:453 start_codon:yes stop_codon:yes gene_type:complete